jgi:hypothetical protein
MYRNDNHSKKTEKRENTERREKRERREERENKEWQNKQRIKYCLLKLMFKLVTRTTKGQFWHIACDMQSFTSLQVTHCKTMLY